MNINFDIFNQTISLYSETKLVENNEIKPEAGVM